MIEVVPANAAMIAQFGEPSARTTRTFAIVDGERVLCVAGLYAQGARWCLFSMATDEVRQEYRYRRSIVRLTRKLMSVAQRIRAPVHALADPSIRGSPVPLLHMGFRHIGGGLYEWR